MAHLYENFARRVHPSHLHSTATRGAASSGCNGLCKEHENELFHRFFSSHDTGSSLQVLRISGPARSIRRQIHHHMYFIALWPDGTDSIPHDREGWKTFTDTGPPLQARSDGKLFKAATMD